MLYALIVAGGQGTRLWPISRKDSPKQLQPFDDEQTMLQKTFSRLRKIVPAENIFVETNALYKEEFFSQLPELVQEQLIAEPIGRNTAAAVGLAVAIIAKHDPEATIINAWADHFVANVEEYKQKVLLAEKLLETYPDYLLDVVVRPEYPATGFGYLEGGEILAEIDETSIYKSVRFVEKPDLATAEKYMIAGNYFWNTGMLVCKTKTLLSLYQQYMPEMYKGLMRIQAAWGTENQDRELLAVFPHLESISAEYGVFEKTDKIAIVPADLGWRDVGGWQAVYDILNQVEGAGQLIKKGRVEAVDTHDSLIFNQNEGKLVAVVGMSDVVIVDTPDALLVMKKSKDQDIKKIVDTLKEQGEVKHL
ncbi:MAG: sugar phosphate nucleotidyltransferase [Patescibacteria group bacterium]|jgi:mannose-1-phosphate guanylyltransferase